MQRNGAKLRSGFRLDEDADYSGATAPGSHRLPRFAVPLFYALEFGLRLRRASVTRAGVAGCRGLKGNGQNGHATVTGEPRSDRRATRGPHPC
ncbi:hypothetical protein BN2475_690074 [Paraburkholderia ribeironis]|uniref:Uncharacterized protein n=1 Tax=Paraburkholderia ribeironis TaxID=1247936 RepID=A0A1N7SHF4_9BURK|nr:hypothetical protein BN2475_690074 [Paraburkholderia ribeironis]